MAACATRIASRLAALCLLAAPAPASALVTFCNEFGHAIWIAIAYPQSNETWVSRGWLALNKGECAPFDTALKLHAIYFRAESVEFKDARGKRVRQTWGKDRAFAIWEDDNFNYWDADKKVLNSRLEPFVAGPTTTDADGLAVIITIQADAIVTSLDTKPRGGESGKTDSPKN
jgi:hypothetical protein